MREGNQEHRRDPIDQGGVRDDFSKDEDQKERIHECCSNAYGASLVEILDLFFISRIMVWRPYQPLCSFYYEWCSIHSNPVFHRIVHLLGSVAPKDCCNLSELSHFSHDCEHFSSTLNREFMMVYQRVHFPSSAASVFEFQDGALTRQVIESVSE